MRLDSFCLVCLRVGRWWTVHLSRLWQLAPSLGRSRKPTEQRVRGRQVLPSTKCSEMFSPLLYSCCHYFCWAVWFRKRVLIERIAGNSFNLCRNCFKTTPQLKHDLNEIKKKSPHDLSFIFDESTTKPHLASGRKYLPSEEKHFVPAQQVLCPRAPGSLPSSRMHTPAVTASGNPYLFTHNSIKY